MPDLDFTCARCDCFVVSLRFGKCEENWETNTERLLVTDLASFANFDKPGKIYLLTFLLFLSKFSV